MKSTAMLLTLGATLTWAAGCAGSADDLCTMATAHIESCTGVRAPAQAATCDQEAAHAVLGTSCENLLDGTRSSTFFGDLFGWLFGGGGSNNVGSGGLSEPGGGDPPPPDQPAPQPDQPAPSQCAVQGGRCQWSSGPCGGQYKAGLCPGPSSFQCCLPQAQPAPSPDGKPHGSWCQTPDGACVVYPPQPLESWCKCGDGSSPSGSITN